MSQPPAHRSLPPPILVEDSRGLRDLVAALEREREIAVDTEADSFYHYRERVCLIQISAGERDWLVDPLRDLDLAPLGDLLADPARTKVFHDGEYDVLILKRDFGFRFAGLFDTRIASSALGKEAPGLAAVVKDRFGVELDKSLQRSDWSARPLSPKQIDYARLDTHFLVRLMHELRGELETRGRSRIVEGECRRLESLAPSERSFQPDEYIRLKGARALDPHQQQALRELFVLRDRFACERDVPPFKVLGNAEMLEIARARPRSPHELARVFGLSPKIVHRLGQPILAALAQARAKGALGAAPSLPSRDGTSALDEAGFELHERLKNWRKDEAEAHGFDSSLVLNRHVLLRLAEARPRDLSALAAVDGVLAWQIELFGAPILAVIERFEAELRAGRLELPRSRRSRRSRDERD